jgi:ribosome-binding protein aMBF1 (putative translation factor)
MKHGDSGFRFNPIATEENPDGSQGRQYMTGSMHELPSVSANYCQTLESAAVQAEFEEKRRNDPRNWSQLRQQYEAFRSMKDVINEPAERIPEEWVRSTIARIQGIKPEDVTLKQIAFEVAGLLSSTKRHIEMIPSAPQGSPPALEPEPSEGNAVQSEPKPTPVPAPVETVAAQLQRLRKECNWSAERLAEAVKFDPRTVTRHLSGETTPHLRNIAAYERVFSKQLKRQVVINKMP